jgi:hypothetical protein
MILKLIYSPVYENTISIHSCHKERVIDISLKNTNENLSKMSKYSKVVRLVSRSPFLSTAIYRLQFIISHIIPQPIIPSVGMSELICPCRCAGAG